MLAPLGREGDERVGIEVVGQIGRTERGGERRREPEVEPARARARRGEKRG